MHVAAKKRETGDLKHGGPVSGWQGTWSHVDPDNLCPVSPGELVLGRYALERQLGSGGMGVVWLARHIELEQHVAIKFLRREFAKTQALVGRFLEEARAAAALRSEHIVRVTDVGVLPTGVPYFIMEYLEGTDLETLVREQGPLSPERAVDFMLQACDALMEAHTCGIVHRDVKPENLFVIPRSGRRPLVKVVDFGIAKRLDPTRARVVTAPQDNMGSPCYMSPEQMSAPQSVDARTDIWSLGVVLYQILTGELPFDGETVVEVFARVVNAKARPLGDFRPELDGDLDAVIQRCLEKDPQGRFQTVSALSGALEAYASTALGRTSSEPPPLQPSWYDVDARDSGTMPFSATVPSSEMTTTAPVALCRVSSRPVASSAPVAKRTHVRQTSAAAAVVWMVAFSGIVAYAKTVPGMTRIRQVTPSWLMPALLAPDEPEIAVSATADRGMPYIVGPLGVVTDSPTGDGYLAAIPEVGAPADETDDTATDDASDALRVPAPVSSKKSEGSRAASESHARAYRDLDGHGYRPLRDVLRDVNAVYPTPPDVATQIAAPPPEEPAPPKEARPDDARGAEDMKEPAPNDDTRGVDHGDSNPAAPPGDDANPTTPPPRDEPAPPRDEPAPKTPSPPVDDNPYNG